MWGLVSNILQNLLFSIFFVIIARIYSESEFGKYVIANTIYSFVMGFSSLGLGHWFVRELINSEDKKKLIHSFFKIQGLIGIFFYFLNIGITTALYEDPLIRNISVILGINIIFDNIINAVKSLNVANQEQKKTFTLLTVEAALKCLISLFLLYWKLDIVTLSMILIFLRIITLNLFLKLGSSSDLQFMSIVKSKVPWSEIKQVVINNWPFIVIGSISIINWRIGNILVSKWLSIFDVAVYEISFKLFSLAYILPVVVSTTVYPMLIKAYQNGLAELSKLYHRIFFLYTLFGFLAFCFVYGYADWFVPLLFGEKYGDISFFVTQMFFSILIFPTIFLQANVMLTLKLEKLDMICNVFSLLANLCICTIGLHYKQNLMIINLGLFSSFLFFHVIQDVILIKRKVTNWKKAISFYILIFTGVVCYLILSSTVGKYYAFPILLSIIMLIFISSKTYFLNKFK